MNNLLSQRKEIKRLEKEFEKGLRETVEEDKERDAEERARAIDEFEKTMMGLEEKSVRTAADGLDEDADATQGRGVKRKRGLDEEEMLKNAREEKAKARKAIDDEKAAEPRLPSFWVPSLTPSTKADRKSAAAPTKLNPLCPASSAANKHNISLRSLVTINFQPSKDPGPASQGQGMICPACIKALNNTNKAIMTVPCGHVLCKPCAGKLMTPDTGPPDPHASPGKRVKARQVVCYVCSTDLTADDNAQERGGKKKGQKSGKVEVRPGLVELKCDGTGFAGGGDNMVQKYGTAFQC